MSNAACKRASNHAGLTSVCTGLLLSFCSTHLRTGSAAGEVRSAWAAIEAIRLSDLASIVEISRVEPKTTGRSFDDHMRSG